MSTPNSTPPFDLKDYRQPMVTAIGIILGFLVGFLGNWVTESNFKIVEVSDRITFYGCLIGSFCLFAALYRMLNIPPSADLSIYYKRTLYIFSFGVIMAFMGIIISGFL